jgi:hypothetical protein
MTAIIHPDDFTKIKIEMNKRGDAVILKVHNEDTFALTVVFDSIIFAAQEQFKYLPTQEQADIAHLLGAMFTLGCLTGSDPHIVHAILNAQEPRVAKGLELVSPWAVPPGFDPGSPDHFPV